MSRLRVLPAISVLPMDSVVAAGCARSDQPSTGASGDTVTTPRRPGHPALRISGGVAHVRLHGRPAGNGATVTVATLIMATLTQFRSIDHVKLYDPSGHTQHPGGRCDSISASLEP